MKRKLNLNDLKVQSFITEVVSPDTVNGGAATVAGNICTTNASQIIYSACKTCGIVCYPDTSPQGCNQ